MREREREREYKESKEGKMFATTESGRLGSIVSFARKLKELSISVCFIKLTKTKKELKASNVSSELVIALLLWIHLYI